MARSQLNSVSIGSGLGAMKVAAVGALGAETAGLGAAVDGGVTLAGAVGFAGATTGEFKSLLRVSGVGIVSRKWWVVRLGVFSHQIAEREENDRCSKTEHIRFVKTRLGEKVGRDHDPHTTFSHH